MLKQILFIFISLVLMSVAHANCVLQGEIKGVIGPATYDYFLRLKHQAQEKKCEAILLHVNTPGGQLQSTRLLVEDILNSSIPVLCFIFPRGAHAGSSGAIILQACHVNGAVPTTSIGAATPIQGQGQDIGEDLRKKILNDTVSWVEGMAKLRKRNEEFARAIVTEARSLDATKAKQEGAIDFLAENPTEFLQMAQGKMVQVKENLTPLQLSSNIETFLPDTRHDILQWVTDPELTYLIFMASLGLIYFEITHPGMIAPGVIGALGLVVSLVSFHKLDVWWGGLILILLGLAFMVAEAFVPSFGALGVGGVVALIVGSVFLFDPAKTGYSLSWFVILPTVLILVSIMAGLIWLVWNSRKLKVQSGVEALVGQNGRVVRIDEQGQLWMELQGELWKITSDEQLKVNDLVEVKSVHGLTLNVMRRS